MFTARYAQSPYITQIRFVFKRLRRLTPFVLTVQFKVQNNKFNHNYLFLEETNYMFRLISNHRQAY